MKCRMLAAICLATVCFAGCSESTVAETETMIASETAETAAGSEEMTDTDAEETETGINENIAPSSDMFTMDDYTEPVCGAITNEAPLYEDEYVTITADSFETDSTDTYLFLTVKNNTDQDLSINCTYSALNDYLIDCAFSDDIAAGSETETALSFENTFINASGIHTITSAELAFTLFDLEDYNILAETGILAVTTDADPDRAQDDVVNGELLYSLNNFQIIGKGILEDDDGLAMIALLFVNQSDKDIFISLNEGVATFDHADYDSDFAAEIPKGKNAIKFISAYDPEEGHVEFAESAELTFLIQDMETFEVIDTTEPITVLREAL